jgi:hypothetical protein
VSDWLYRKLARDLAPVTAPHELAARLGFAPAKRREFSRAVLTLAAGVVLLIGGGYTAVRTAALGQPQRRSATRVAAALWLPGESRADVPLVAANSVPPAAFRLLRCDGGAGMRPQLAAGKATVLLAHAGSAHALYAAPESGCHLCHNL